MKFNELFFVGLWCEFNWWFSLTAKHSDTDRFNEICSMQWKIWLPIFFSELKLNWCYFVTSIAIQFSLIFYQLNIFSKWIYLFQNMTFKVEVETHSNLIIFVKSFTSFKFVPTNHNYFSLSFIHLYFSSFFLLFFLEIFIFQNNFW